MLFLLRALGLKERWSLAGGMFWEGSGSLFAQLAFNNTGAIFMMPWALWSAHRLVNEPSSKTAAVAAFIIGITALGGHPVLTTLAFIAFALYWIGSVVVLPNRKSYLPIVGWSILAVILGLMISAVATLPLLELIQNGISYKSGAAGEKAWEFRLFAARYMLPLALFTPSILAATRDMLPAGFWPTAQGASIGLTVLFLALSSFLKMERKLVPLVFVLLIGIALTLVPIGTSWIHSIPIIKTILPWYGYPLITLPLCAFAAVALNRLDENRRLSSQYTAPALLILAGFVVTAGANFGANWVKLPPTAFLSLLAVPVILILLLRCKTYPRLINSFIALAFLEILILRVTTIFHPQSVALTECYSEKCSARGSILSSSDQYRFIAPSFTFLMPNASILFEQRDFRSCSPLPISRYTKYLDLIGPWDHNTFQYPGALQIPLLSKAAVSKVINVTRKYPQSGVLLNGYENTHDDGLVQLWNDSNVALFENQLTLQRIRVSQNVERAFGQNDAINKLNGLKNADLWAQTTVIELPEIWTDTLPTPTPGISNQIVASEDVSPDLLKISVNFKQKGFLVISDTFYPGWKTYLDGRETQIFPADLMFRAISSPIGKHQIELIYDPISFKIAAWVTVLGLLFAFAALFLRKRNVAI
ncbi:MAG: hypothetical protein V4534_02130 [Myxococcota bacterium]